MDIYSIGLKVDSRQVKTAQKDLGGMGRQAKQTGSSVQKFGNNVDKSTRSIGGMGKGLELAKRALGGFAAALSIRQLQAFTQASLDAAQTIDRQARSLSMSAEEFQRISFAFRQFGADSSDISDAFNTLSDRAQDAKDGMQSFIDDFKLVGIEVDDLKGKDPGELFRLFAEGVSNVEDPTQRAAGVVRILGDDVGRRLLPMLMDGTEGLDALGKQANIASDEVIESSARIQTDLTQLGTELETGLQNAFLGAAVSNEEQIRSLVATTLRGMATIADFADEVSGPLGAGLIGRVLFGKKGAIIGTLLTSAVQTVNALIDRVNETSGQAIVRLQERAESLEQTISGLPEIHPVRQAAEADLERVQAKLDDLNAQRMDSIEIENQYQKALKNTGDVGEEIGDVLRDAADAFEAGGTSADKAAKSMFDFGEESENAAEKATDAADEIQKEFDRVADSIEAAFSDAFYDIFDEGLDAFDDLADSIGDIFKRTLADMAAAAIRQQIVIPITQQVTGGVGQAMGLPGTSSLVTSGLQSVGNFALGSGGGGSGIGSIAGSVGRSILGPGAGIGQSIAMSGIGQSLGLSGSLSAAGGGLIQGGAGAMGGQALTGAGSALAGAAGIALPIAALAILGGLFDSDPDESAARIFATGGEGFLDFVPSIYPGDALSQEQADELEQEIEKSIQGQARSLQKAVMNTVGMSMAERLSTGIVEGDLQEPFAEHFFKDDGSGMPGAINALLARLFRPLNEFIPGALNTAIDRLDPESENYAQELMAITETFGDVNRRVVAELADFTEETDLVGSSFVEKLQNLGSALTALDARGDLDLVDEITGFDRQAENIQAFVQVANSVDQLSDSYKDQDQLITEARERLTEFSEEAGRAGNSALLSTDRFRAYIESIDLTSAAGRKAAQSALQYSDSLQLVAQEQQQLNQELQDRRGLELQLLNTFNRSAQGLQRQLMGMTEEQAALQVAISLRQQVSAAEQEVADAEQDLISIYQEQASTAENLADSLQETTKSLRDAADEILGVGTSEPGRSRTGFSEALQRALSGDQEAMQALPQLAEELSQAERGQAGTLAEARRANAKIAVNLDRAADMAEQQYMEQLSEAEVAQRQLDELQEQDRSLQDVKAAVRNSQDVLASAQQASIRAIDNVRMMMPTSIVTGLLKPLSPLASIEANTAAMINSLNNLDAATVQEEAVRTSGGAAQAFNEGFYLREKRDQLNAIAHEGRTNWTVPEVEAAFREASLTPKAHFEIFGRDEGLSPAPGFADGGIASGPMSGFQATLHGTEAVIPLNGQRIPLEVNNQEMIQELRDLRQEVSQLRTEQGQSQYQIARNTKRTRDTLEQFDIEGLPPERSAT